MPEFYIAAIAAKIRFEFVRNRIRFGELGIQDFSVVTDSTDRSDFFSPPGRVFRKREISGLGCFGTIFDETLLLQLNVEKNRLRAWWSASMS